jgi:flagellar hook-length control protein FliK
MTVLKTSFDNVDQSGNNGKATATQESDSTTAAVAAGSALSKNSPDIKEKTGSRQIEDPLDILRQLLLQMAGAANQIVPQPAIKEAVVESQVTDTTQSPEATSSFPVNPLLSLNANAPAQPANTVKNDEGAQAINQGAYLNALTENAVKPAGISDHVSGQAKSLQQGNLFDAVSESDGSAKANSLLKFVEANGKNTFSSTSLSATSGDEFGQMKIGTGLGQTAGEGNSLKDVSQFYAQSAQGMHTSSGTGPAQETVPVSRLTSVDEIISKAVDTGQKTIVIRIDPPDLGNVQIRLSLDKGVLRADVRVDSNSVKDAFNLAIPQIRTSLENSGIRVSDFHVDVRDEQNGNAQSNNDSNKQKQRQDGEARQAFSGFFA